MENLKPKDVADILGISYPTLKQWIYAGKIKSVKTPGGHHRIPAEEVERISGNRRNPRPRSSEPHAGSETISVRNRLAGTVTNISYEGLFAEVTMNVGNQHIVSIITRAGCDEIGLKVGMRAFALFKATEVMISPGTN
jgi:molybdopterin-binding protein